MSDFQTKYPEAKNLDPYKRVKYSQGLVLGVDEFNQEELYILEKQHLHNRALHGYGTFCGLKVTLKEDEEAIGSWKLIVAPGYALDPQGREIRVPQAQCADLISWLNKEKNRKDILNELGLEESSPPLIISPPATLSLCLVLCYTQCDTDFVPVPSGPCQSLDKTSVPSRTADDFDLRLEVETKCPEQREEIKLKELIELLKSIEISEAPGGLSQDDISPLVHSILSDETPPVFSPPIGEMHMRSSEAELFINIAMRIWVTEVRSKLLPSERNCSAGPIDESCVFLAKLDFSIEDTEAGLRIVGKVALDEEQRPLLLQTRLLQENILQCCAGTSQGGIGSPPSSSIDETNLMHLTADETVEGIKTFTDPLAFDSDGKFTKRIRLSPAIAMFKNETKASKDFYRAGIPAIKYINGGEASFNITVPDDIDYAIKPRVRIIWGVKPDSAGTISYKWTVRNRFLGPAKKFGSFSSNTISDTETDAAADTIYVTESINLTDKVLADDVFGALRIELSSIDPPETEIYLLHAEITYTADRLGRPF